MNPDSGTDTSPEVDVFEDPVRYLAAFGIVAEVVGDTTFPAAA